MDYLDFTYDDPAHNLACDEVLLNLCNAGDAAESLRVWEPHRYFIVAGYSNHITIEANHQACASDGVAIHRRLSGGGTVLQGPGCLNYAVVLRFGGEPPPNLTETYRLVLERHRQLLAGLVRGRVTLSGVSDLAIGGRKFSGNSQYRKRRSALVHGTFLLDFDIERIERYLPMPSKAPEYRRDRSHFDFLDNLPVDAASLKLALRGAWGASRPVEPPPLELVDAAVRERYGSRDWNYKF